MLHRVVYWSKHYSPSCGERVQCYAVEIPFGKKRNNLAYWLKYISLFIFKKGGIRLVPNRGHSAGIFSGENPSDNFLVVYIYITLAIHIVFFLFTWVYTPTIFFEFLFLIFVTLLVYHDNTYPQVFKQCFIKPTWLEKFEKKYIYSHTRLNICPIITELSFECHHDTNAFFFFRTRYDNWTFQYININFS